MQLFDLYYPIIWITLLILLQLIVFLTLYPRFGDIALPISFSGSILLFSLISWYVTILGLSINYTLLIFILLGILGLILTYRNHRSPIKNWHYYYIVFIGCFFVFLLARMLSPNILGEEKFMDFAYIHSLYRYPVIPPVDIWYSGEPFTVYYYFGYWIFASLGSLLKIPPQILFNLILPTVAALTAVNLYGMGTLFSKRYSYITLSLIFLPNIGLIWLLISGYSLLDAYNGSFHVINGTSNEYMAVSFLIADVHAHVIAFVVQTYLIFLLCYWCKFLKNFSPQDNLILGIVVALSLGSLVPLNTWNIFLYAPLFLCTISWIIFKKYQKVNISFYKRIKKFKDTWHNYHPISGRRSSEKPSFLLLLYLLIGIPLISIALYIPYYLQSQGRFLQLGLVHDPSSIIEFLIIWGIFFIILGFRYWEDIRTYPYVLLILFPGVLFGYASAACGILFIVLASLRREDIRDLLVIIGFGAVVFCEFFYLKDDTFQAIYRFNTVYKFYSASWVLIGCAALICIAEFCDDAVKTQTKDKLLTYITICVVGIGIFSIVPITILSYGISDNCGLRGDAFLQKSLPSDALAISFLRNLTGTNLIVEASDFYNDGSILGRISVFSGIPTILGWYAHEFQWRGDQVSSTEIMNRVIAIKQMYENPQLCLYLMDMYGANLLYIGPIERTLYNISLPNEGFDTIYQENEVLILKRNSVPVKMNEIRNTTVSMSFPNTEFINQHYKEGYRYFPT